MRKFYIIKPFKVGSTGKSLAMVIPAQLAKEYQIDFSTMLALRTDERKEKITLRAITGLLNKFDDTTSAGESFHASTQQISSIGDQ